MEVHPRQSCNFHLNSLTLSKQEQHDVLGGTTHTFVEEGRFEFGTGLHYVGGALARSKLLDALCDGQLEWAEMDPDYDHAELLDAP
ncbi:hypothetical protein SARC_16920, partial [Sphaeroforma arctica JP610]